MDLTNNLDRPQKKNFSNPPWLGILSLSGWPQFSGVAVAEGDQRGLGTHLHSDKKEQRFPSISYRHVPWLAQERVGSQPQTRMDVNRLK